MQNKVQRYLIAVLIIMTFIIGFSGYFGRDCYVQFKPVYFNYTARKIDDSYVISEEKPSTEYLNNLKIVLQFYGETYKEENNKIFVSRSLWKDRDLMINYTKKAGDENWISEHRKSARG